MEGSLLTSLKHAINKVIKLDSSSSKGSIQEDSTASLGKTSTNQESSHTFGLDDSALSTEDISDSFCELGSVCEGTGSMIAQRIPPSVQTPATALPEFKLPSSDQIQNFPNTESSRYLINNGLLEAAEKNKPEMCKQLLICPIPANVNFKGLNEYAALHLAANEGHIKVCLVLLQNGADPNVRNYMERTPLHLACIRGHFKVAEMLLAFGADLNVLDIDRNSPLHFAAEYGHSGIVAWLLMNKPELAIRNRLGKYPADCAASKEVAMLFREHMLSSTTCTLSPPNSATRTCRSPRRVQIHSMGEEAKDRGVGPLDFEIITELGRGSFGEVYMVIKKDTSVVYAMKVLRKDKIMGQNLVKYAMTERNVLSYIKHPFIVGLNFAFQTSDKLFLILDYCSGGDLASHLRRERKFEEWRARVYICEIVLAFEELHKRDIIFRDLKPDNVVIDAEGHALLTDFGLSKEGVYDNYMARSFCGSVAYLAPEMLRRQGHGKAVDWYLLGVLLYEMMVGRPPYFSHNKEELFQNIQRGKLKIPSSLSPDVKSLLRRLLQRDPAMRLGSGKRDAEEIKEHSFFQNINWESVARRELKPPIPARSSVPTTRIDPETIYGDLSRLSDGTNKFTGWTFVSS